MSSWSIERYSFSSIILYTENVGYTVYICRGFAIIDFKAIISSLNTNDVANYITSTDFELQEGKSL